MIIHSKIKDYRLDVVDDIWASKPQLSGMPKLNRLFYFIDSKVFKLYEAQLRKMTGSDFVLKIDADERNKEYVKMADYYRALIEAGFTRNDCLVTFGGGIVQDISGFIASTLYRGIKWVYVPTTLLAQADSCIGSKTSINFGASKNLIGTFYPPDVVLLDINFTRTLNPSDFNSGLGEIIKFHLLSDTKGYEFLNKYFASQDLRGPLFKDIILSTLKIKQSYFEGDEFDTGRRNLLNYGHCFGHALESASNFAVAHGEAVLVGMGFANVLSLKRGILSRNLYEEWEVLLRRFYPAFDLGSIRAQDIIAHLKKDKKRSGPQLTMILARGVGDHYKADDVSELEIIETFNEFIKAYPLVPHA